MTYFDWLLSNHNWFWDCVCTCPDMAYAVTSGVIYHVRAELTEIGTAFKQSVQRDHDEFSTDWVSAEPHNHNPLVHSAANQ